MKLSELTRVTTASLPSDPDLISLHSDSRLVGPGSAFVALKGSALDGKGFIANALKMGASAIFLEEHDQATRELERTTSECPFVVIPNLRAQLPHLLNEIQGRPLERLFAIGITGTNGKSTIAKLTTALLRAWGRKVVSLGTISNEIGDEELPAVLTTPGPVELFELLKRGVETGCDHLVMEVSSHALSQERVAGFKFERAVFTNLTQDHLDYHGDLESYFLAKRKLFTEHLSQDGIPILNLDNDYGKRLLQELGDRCVTFSTQQSEGGSPSRMHISLLEYRLDLDGTWLKIGAGADIHELRSSLIGQINVENLLALVALGKSLDIPWDTILSGVSNVKVPGRNELLRLPGGALAVVDYAHTPDALERVLKSLRPMCKGKLWCVFGCGGDRDRTKRPLMGKIAESIADHVILTNDNPRTEEPGKILAEIRAGLSRPEVAMITEDRKSAIRQGLGSLALGDCLLVAGKGHEDYQIIGTQKSHFSDQEIIREWASSQRENGV